jgi:hypothetical protein
VGVESMAGRRHKRSSATAVEFGTAKGGQAEDGRVAVAYRLRVGFPSGDGRSTGPDRLGGPAAGDQLAVPAQDGGRCDEQLEAAADRKQWVRAAIRAQSVQLICGRGVRPPTRLFFSSALTRSHGPRWRACAALTAFWFADSCGPVG